MKLNDLAIRRAKPRLDAYHLSDGRGLFLLITPAGTRSWRYKYKFGGSGRTLTYGQYPDVSLLDAREKHAQARRVLATGVDPTAARKAEKASQSSSFRAVAKTWLKHWEIGKSAKHVSVTTQRLDDYVYPVLGNLGVDDIDATHLLKMVKPIDASGKAETARRVLEVVGMIFRHGVAHGLAKRNPVADFKPKDVLKPKVSKNHARVGNAELPGLLRGIEVYRGKVVTRLALKLMALTWPRTAELIGGRWSEIDTEARRWDIPGERMKEGRPHIIPLSTQALEVLELLREVTGRGELMFPGDVAPQQTMSRNTILEALDRMGYQGRMTGHGFRSVASTALHESGFLHDHIEIQLAHLVGNQSSAPYNHALYLAPRTEMMQWWADYLDQARRRKVLNFPDADVA